MTSTTRKRVYVLLRRRRDLEWDAVGVHDTRDDAERAQAAAIEVAIENSDADGAEFRVAVGYFTDDGFFVVHESEGAVSHWVRVTERARAARWRPTSPLSKEAPKEALDLLREIAALPIDDDDEDDGAGEDADDLLYTLYGFVRRAREILGEKEG